MIYFILGIIVGILLSLLAMFYSKEMEKIERQIEDRRSGKSTKPAQIIKSDKLEELLKWKSHPLE